MRREERELILKQGVSLARDAACAAGSRGAGRGHPFVGAPRPAAAAAASELPARGRRVPLRPRWAAPVHGSASHDHGDDRRPRAAARRRLEGAGDDGSRRRGDSPRTGGSEVEAWSFDEVNDLIDRHNRFYPAESRLPMDPRTRDYALVGRRGLSPPSARCSVGARTIPARPRARLGGLKKAARLRQRSVRARPC